MYHKHNNWEEDKWDIHRQGNSSGYAGHGTDDSEKDYHKQDMYGANKSEEGKANDIYRSMENQKNDDDKEKEEKDKNIVDAVEQEEKYQKKDDDKFKDIEQDMKTQNSMRGHELNEQFNGKDKNKRNKKNKSIEDAINESIKKEKEVIHMD